MKRAVTKESGRVAPLLLLSHCYLLCYLPTLGSCQLASRAALHQLADEFWEWQLEEHPETATIQGFHQYDDRLESYAFHKFDSRWNTCNAFLLRCKSINRTSLLQEDLLTLDVLTDQLQTFIDGYKYKDYSSLNPINFMEGIHRYDGWIKEARFTTVEDYNAYISRLYKLPTQIEEIISLLERAIQMKRTYHEVSMRNVADDLQQLSEADPDKTVYFEPVRGHLDHSGLPFHDRQMVRSKVLTAISSMVQPAFKRLRNYIMIRYMAHTRREYGIWSLENGTDYYRSALRWHLSVDMDPDEVFQLGMEEVSRIEGRMRSLMAWLGFDDGLKEFFDFLGKQRRFYNHTEDQFLDLYKRAVYVRAQPRLPMLFTNLASIPNITASYNVLPIALHEAVPGHHLQIAIAQHQSLASFRRYAVGGRKFSVPFSFPYYTAYVEGWGLYAEFLGEELGLYEHPYEQFGRYCLEMLRACRLVIDTGIHIKRWSRDQAIEFMSNYTTLSREQVEVEIDRYITWPGQACAYKIGEIKLKEMRRKAETTLGFRFNVRDFHAQILNVGPLPLRMLERLIDSWVESQSMSSGSTGLGTKARTFLLDYWIFPLLFLCRVLEELLQ